jgi:OHCU decarboxylase
VSAIIPSELGRAEFITLFGGVYEHSPWVAEKAFEMGVDSRVNSAEGLAQVLSTVFLDADKDRQRQVILAHPDLAGKAAIKGELTKDSTREQSGAGIDQCSAEELARFEKFNTQYKNQFKFPFIMAVKGSNRYAILDAFENRLQNDVETEFQTALQEINKIALFRLQSILNTQQN